MTIVKREKLNLYIENFIEASVELMVFKYYLPDFPEGSISSKNAVKKTPKKTYSYKAHYHDVTIEVNGKKKRKGNYIRQKDFKAFEEIMNAKKEQMAIQRRLNRQKNIWKRRIDYFVNKGDIGIDELNIQIKERAEQIIRENEHKKSKYKDIANPKYKFLTRWGEVVRSKNELLVADALRELKVPYLYEKVLLIKDRPGGFSMYLEPDFTINLNGEKVFIEVLGMMGEEYYSDNTIRKIAEYKINGIELGRNLVCISTGLDQEFNQRKLRDVLERMVKYNEVPQDIVVIDIEEERRAFLEGRSGIA